MRISEAEVYIPLEEYYDVSDRSMGSISKAIRKHLKLTQPDAVLQRINGQRMFKDKNKVEFSISVSKRERKR